MLGSKDPVTGEFLSEDAIVKNVSTTRFYFSLAPALLRFPLQLLTFLICWTRNHVWDVNVRDLLPLEEPG